MLRLLGLVCVMVLISGTCRAQDWWLATGRYECEHDPSIISGPATLGAINCESAHFEVKQSLTPPMCGSTDPSLPSGYVYIDVECIEGMARSETPYASPAPTPILWTVKWVNTYEQGKLGVERQAATIDQARAAVESVSREWETRSIAEDGTPLGKLLSSIETSHQTTSPHTLGMAECGPAVANASCCLPHSHCAIACPTPRNHCTPSRKRCGLLGRLRR